MKLIQGDCLIEMQSIPDKSIDMILCDLPYGTIACKWDMVIPFDLLWDQYERIIVDTGAIVLFASQPFTANLISSNYTMFKYCWVWDKVRPFGFLDSKIRPMKRHEDVCVFSKAGCSNGSKPIMSYFPQDLVYSPRLNRKSRSNILNSEPQKNIVMAEYTNYPQSILTFSPDKNVGHPTQKPVPLLEYLIKTYTLEGETVLDNTMGSGSTGVACVNTKRDFIGIELDKTYFDIATKRIQSAMEGE